MSNSSSPVRSPRRARTFIAARERRLPSAHPNYAYFIACCHARLGDLAAARDALRAASDGSLAADQVLELAIEAPRSPRRGEKVALADDPSIVALRALPGLDRPFRVARW
jgi:hypothetical protein